MLSKYDFNPLDLLDFVIHAPNVVSHTMWMGPVEYDHYTLTPKDVIQACSRIYELGRFGLLETLGVLYDNDEVVPPKYLEGDYTFVFDGEGKLITLLNEEL